MDLTQDVGARLLAEIAAMLRELRGSSARAPGLDDELETALGIDSLARMELMLRLERAFDVHLPAASVQAARTPRDLLRALAAASPRSAMAVAPSAPASSPVQGSPPVQAGTLVEVLQWQAARAGSHRHITLLRDDGEPDVLTNGELLSRAQAVAAGLEQRGVAAGEAVALMLPTGLEFFAAFAGIVLAGAVPVPIYPPLSAARIEEHLRRQAGILDNAQAVLLVADEAVLAAARVLRALVPGVHAVLTVPQIAVAGAAPAAVPRTVRDVALLQYTSGSTGLPKGVVLTHENLLANLRAMGEVLAPGPGDVFVSWLPLYHDMGLIGAWMGTLYFGFPLVLMAPQRFLARPSRWLQAIHDYRGTISAAPNFAYEVLATKVPDGELEGLDLRCWRAAVNGAEPVHAATLRRFADRFARSGFDRGALMPVYGLAESALGIAFPPLNRGPRVDVIDRARLRARGVAQAVPVDAPEAMQVVSCGAPLPGHAIRVVDGLGAELPERHEGRVQFRGPSATSGYMRNPAATRALFSGDWLDTGDVGYLAGGEIHLTSRAKDLIIRGGHNLHPYELEDAVGSLPGARRGCVAVFGAADAASASERIVVVAETRLAGEPARATLREAIAARALALLGTPADDIVLADPHTVPKTSSGKIRRAACRALYEQGLLCAPRRSARRQLARLWLQALTGRARPLLGAAYAARCWGVFGLGAAAGLALALWPGFAGRKRGARALARAVVQGCGLPVTVDGQPHWPDGPVVVVANHASYVDWLLLTAELPAQAVFVAKRELARHAPLRWLLVRIGTRFVARDDVHRSVDDARALVQAARDGATLVFFPEGTLRRAPGLLPFHMGAFVVSAEAGAPLMPVSVDGTRSVLPDGSWWPRRHAVRIREHALLHPAGSGWTSAMRLRDDAFRAIAFDLGEPLTGH